jgi:hypothetical protein
MNRIYALALAAGLAALPFAGNAQAQQADSVKRQRAPQAAMAMRQGPNAAGRILALREELKLTSEQVSRLESLQKQQADQHKRVMEQTEAARKQMRENAEVTRKEIEATLNDEQKAQLKQRVERRVERRRMHRERMQLRRGDRGGAHAGA